MSHYPPDFRPWFVRIGERTHPWLLPAVLLLFCSLPYFIGDLADTEFGQYGMAEEQMRGTGLLFALLPAYCMITQFYAWRIGAETVAEFAPITPAQGRVHGQALHTGPGLWVGLIVFFGTLYGSNDFSELEWLARIDELHWFDIWYRLSAAFAWGFVFWMVAWRLLAAFAQRRLGRSLCLDVYQLEEVGRFVRLPVFCLLIVAGGLALMPLQALDQELRWINFRAGIFVGVPAALLFFFLPILGLHRNMQTTIRNRVGEVQALINDCDRSDFSQLALLTEHRETVRDFPAWPLDVALIGKAVFYLFIPPLAWVAAALVERAVDSLV